MLTVLLLIFLSIMSSSKSLDKRKRHISHDGSIREYNYETHEWIIIQTSNDNDKQNDDEEKQLSSSQPLAIEGRLFDTSNYFPHLFNKQIMSLESLNKFESTFKINNFSVYIGNMMNNELISRSIIDQQHGDTGNNLWDTSILFAKCLEHNSCDNDKGNKLNLLNVSNKNVLELGTGTGFVGLCTVYCDAKNVYLTDLDYCIKNIQINVDKNRFIWDLNHNHNKKQCEIIKNPFDNVNVFELDWLNYKQSLLKYNGIINKNSIDLIIGSDIIWIKELVPYLVNTLEYLYENILNHKENGIMVIAEQIRSNPVSKLFWSLIKEKGFNKHRISHKFFHPDFVSDKIIISIVSKDKLNL